MKKTLTRTIIITAMILAMAIAAAPVSATEGMGVQSVDITKNRVSTESVTTKVGSNVSLSYKYSYVGEKPDTSRITWTSSNTKVATVKGGQITPKKAGTATITVKLDGQEDTCKVTVKKANNRFVATAGCYTELNKYRKATGKKGLKKDKKLEKIAKIRAEEMAKSGKFSHTRPNGKSGLTLIKGNIYKGENIAMGQRTCKEVSTAWYNSKGHKKNMLKKQYKKVGIAGYEYNGVIYWAQVFSS